MINIGSFLIKRPLIQIQSRMSSMTENKGPVAEAISLAITENLQPLHLEIKNESYMHNVPKGSETHFKVLVVSEAFDDLTAIKRHRLIYQIVRDKLGELFPHALSIEAKTPKQWSPSYVIEPSPRCRGGFGK